MKKVNKSQNDEDKKKWLRPLQRPIHDALGVDDGEATMNRYVRACTMWTFCFHFGASGLS